MNYLEHAKWCKKVAIGLGRRGLKKDAAVFQECAAFCEFLATLKKKVKSPLCWKDYLKLHLKHLKAIVGICKRHPDIPVLAEYVQSRLRGGEYDVEKKEETIESAEVDNEEADVASKIMELFEDCRKKFSEDFCMKTFNIPTIEGTSYMGALEQQEKMKEEGVLGGKRKLKKSKKSTK